MCACEPGFTCSRCAGTPFDDSYHEQEHDPPDFDALIAESTAEPFTGRPGEWV